MTAPDRSQRDATHAQEVAGILLEQRAVAINASEPFVYSSGILSPIYCDLRLLLGTPRQRGRIVEMLADSVIETCGEAAPDVVAGVATAGIPWAAWVAEKLDRPMAYVRDSAKEHGKRQQVEGGIASEQTAIVIEDLTSTGGSALSAVEALRGIGARVDYSFSIFGYEFPQARDAYRRAGVELVSLCGVSTLLEVVTSRGQITEKDERAVREWLTKEPMGASR